MAKKYVYLQIYKNKQGKIIANIVKKPRKRRKGKTVRVKI